MSIVFGDLQIVDVKPSTKNHVTDLLCNQSK